MSSSPSSPSLSKTDTADFKAKLDEEARRAQSHSDNSQGGESRSENQSSGLVEKVAQYIPEPISSKVLPVGRKSPQQQEQQEQDHQKKKDSSSLPPSDVTPKRPDQDENIGEFIRDQYRSTKLKLED